MKALILAAGFGTRLLPYTEEKPKPLFTIRDHTLLDMIIEALAASGCGEIMVNTHHLHHRIEAYITAASYPIPVRTRFEPEILGTGGAVKNLSDFWDERPFLVVNSDIVTNIDFKAVYEYHLSHPFPGTMVLTSYPDLDSVVVDENGFITRFLAPVSDEHEPGLNSWTFTGIQVVDPLILDYIPEGEFSSIIDAYRLMISGGHRIKAHVPSGIYWKDVGTPNRFREAVSDKMIAAMNQGGSSDNRLAPHIQEPLQGDGSDRGWFRIRSTEKTFILADHGIQTEAETTEFDSFVKIGGHLRAAEVKIPEMYDHDRFSGLVLEADLGDRKFQDLINQAVSAGDHPRIEDAYRRVVEELLKFAVKGVAGFDTAWTYQTPSYDAPFIVERECRFFVESFLNGYLDMGISWDGSGLSEVCRRAAETALQHSTRTLMHRDMQSRNIMVDGDGYSFIDYQGARIGPLQYDLASLLIDPYVDLSASTREGILMDAVNRLAPVFSMEPRRFLSSYRFFAVFRNLQILGAFSFLTRIKGKSWFEPFIPRAFAALMKNLEYVRDTDLSALFRPIERAEARMEVVCRPGRETETAAKHDGCKPDIRRI